MKHRLTHFQERHGIFNVVCVIALITLITTSFRFEEKNDQFDFSCLKEITENIYKKDSGNDKLVNPVSKNITYPKSRNNLRITHSSLTNEKQDKPQADESHEDSPPPLPDQKKITPVPKYQQPEWTKKKYSVQNIDINQSDIIDWEALPGIGPFYAKKITNFREKLGGFTSIDQVGETWRLPDSIFQNIRPLLTFSPIYRKININQATTEEFKDHPYLNWKDAQIFTNYRFHRGSFKSVEDVYSIKAFDTVFIKRIIPYLSME